MVARVIVYGVRAPFRCSNFDNDRDADALLHSDVPTRELTAIEIENAFGDDAFHAGGKYAVVTGDTLDAVVVSMNIAACSNDLTSEIEKIQQQLTANDLASVRPLRAKLAGTATDFDDTRLAELEAEAQALRTELATLATQLEELSDQPTT